MGLPLTKDVFSRLLIFRAFSFVRLCKHVLQVVDHHLGHFTCEVFAPIQIFFLRQNLCLEGFLDSLVVILARILCAPQDHVVDHRLFSIEVFVIEGLGDIVELSFTCRQILRELSEFPGDGKEVNHACPFIKNLCERQGELLGGHPLGDRLL